MSDTSEIDREPDEESKLLVVDPDDYRQTRQLKQIHNAKDEYSKLKTADEPTKARIYVQRIQGLIHELEPLMRRLDTKKNYLDDVYLGTVLNFDEDTKIRYSRKQDDLPNSKSEAIQLAKSEGEIEEVELTGLETLIEATGYYTHGQGRRDPAGHKIIKPELTPFDRMICDRAYRFCREFIAEADLGLQIEEDTGPARI